MCSCSLHVPLRVFVRVGMHACMCCVFVDVCLIAYVCKQCAITIITIVVKPHRDASCVTVYDNDAYFLSVGWSVGVSTDCSIQLMH